MKTMNNALYMVFGILLLASACASCYGEALHPFYNVGFEIEKCETDAFDDLSLLISHDKELWLQLGERSLRNNQYFYADTSISSKSDILYFKFVDKNVINELIPDIILHGLAFFCGICGQQSKVFSVNVNSDRTYFLKFISLGYTNLVLRENTSPVSIAPTGANPPRYVFPTQMFTVENHFNFDFKIILPEENCICFGVAINIIWYLAPLGRENFEPEYYDVKFGKVGSSIITNMTVSTTNCVWQPPDTGRYWFKISCTNEFGDTISSKARTFNYIESANDLNIDSDHDGFSNAEEILAGTNPEDNEDIPVLINTDDHTRTIRIEAVANQHISKQLSTKNSIKARWYSNGRMPDGLFLDGHGRLKGICKKTGMYQFTVMAAGNSNTDSAKLEIVIHDELPSQIVPGNGEIK